MKQNSLLPTRAARRRKTLVNLCTAAIVAALYVALTLLSGLFGLSSGAIQVRVSEALCVLPVFLPWSTVGLWIGCIIANVLTSALLWDVVFGSLATLIGALGSLLLGAVAGSFEKKERVKAGKVFKFLSPLPTVVANAVIIPFVLKYAYGITDMGYWFMLLTVGIGEIISAWVLGIALLCLLERNKKIFRFKANDKICHYK